MDKINKLDSVLIQCYQGLGVNDISLQNNCLHCKLCWHEIEERKWSDKEVGQHLDDDDTDPTKIYLPWVGDYYDRQKLFITGINMNHYGGTYAQRRIVGEWVRSGLLEGNKRLLRNDEYAGSFYWYMVPSYAAVLIEKSGSMLIDWNEDGFPGPKTLSNTLDYFSITNSIKCSPKGEKSKPTTQMWENCLSHILKQEIKILNPRQVLILGGSDNFYYFKNEILDQPDETPIEVFNSFKKGKGTIDNEIIEFYSVIHPTALGGNTKTLIQCFKEFVYSDRAQLLDVLMIQLQSLGFEFEVSNSKFGSENSGFYFKIPGWKKFSIGFEFELAWANSFFYGLKKNNLDDDINLELTGEIHERLNIKGSPTEFWPYWAWSQYKNWNDKTFSDIQSGLFLKYVKQIIDDIIMRTNGLDL